MKTLLCGVIVAVSLASGSVLGQGLAGAGAGAAEGLAQVLRQRMLEDQLDLERLTLLLKAYELKVKAEARAEARAAGTSIPVEPCDALVIPPATETCLGYSERLSGLNRICYYRCPGGDAAITVTSAQLCPLSLKR